MAKIKIFGVDFENLHGDFTHTIYNYVNAVNETNMIYNDIDVYDFVEHYHIMLSNIDKINDTFTSWLYKITHDYKLTENDGYILNVENDINEMEWLFELLVYKYENHGFKLNGTFKSLIRFDYE